MDECSCDQKNCLVKIIFFRVSRCPVAGFRRFPVKPGTHILDRRRLSAGSIGSDSLSHSIQPVVSRFLSYDVGRLLRFESENTIRKNVFVCFRANTLLVYFSLNVAVNRRSRGGSRATNSAPGATVFLALLLSLLYGQPPFDKILILTPFRVFLILAPGTVARIDRTKNRFWMSHNTDNRRTTVVCFYCTFDDAHSRV